VQGGMDGRGSCRLVTIFFVVVPQGLGRKCTSEASRGCSIVRLAPFNSEYIKYHFKIINITFDERKETPDQLTRPKNAKPRLSADRWSENGQSYSFSRRPFRPTKVSLSSIPALTTLILLLSIVQRGFCCPSTQTSPKIARGSSPLELPDSTFLSSVSPKRTASPPISTSLHTIQWIAL
jgi:hypothetical protein